MAPASALGPPLHPVPSLAAPAAAVSDGSDLDAIEGGAAGPSRQDDGLLGRVCFAAGVGGTARGRVPQRIAACCCPRDRLSQSGLSLHSPLSLALFHGRSAFASRLPAFR